MHSRTLNSSSTTPTLIWGRAGGGSFMLPAPRCRPPRLVPGLAALRLGAGDGFFIALRVGEDGLDGPLERLEWLEAVWLDARAGRAAAPSKRVVGGEPLSSAGVELPQPIEAPGRAARGDAKAVLCEVLPGAVAHEFWSELRF